MNPDPPARVARLSLTDGNVTLQPAGVQEWAAAEINRPLTTGDSLWVDDIGHAEVEIANGVLRLSAKTGFTILNLDDHTTQIKLTQGNLAVRLSRVNPGEIVEVDTPNTAVSLKKAGSYQLRVAASGDTSVVSVTDGSAEASAGARNVTLTKNQSATVSGVQSPTLALSGQDTGTDRDRYFDARDRRPESMSSAYVADGMVGTSDLDENGTWLSVRGYGMAWIPRVPKGWEPYRFGHWAWVDPWGWSWVDDQPWGFAPFHYGRWIQVDVGWAWLPGGAGVQAAYSPAMVAWTGAPGAGPGPGAGPAAAVGWFPLGPNEVYVPSFNASPKYMNLVNATNVNVANVNVMRVNPSQANYSYRSQTTMVSHDTFVGGGHVSERTMLPMSRTDMARSRVSNVAGAAPQKESILGPQAGRQRMSQPPPGGDEPDCSSSHRAPPAAPVPFEMQQRSLVNNQGRPMSSMERQRVPLAVRTDVLPAASRPEGREPLPGVRATGREPMPAVQPSSGPRTYTLEEAACRPRGLRGRPLPRHRKTPERLKPPSPCHPWSSKERIVLPHKPRLLKSRKKFVRRNKRPRKSASRTKRRRGQRNKRLWQKSKRPQRKQQPRPRQREPQPSLPRVLNHLRARPPVKPPPLGQAGRSTPIEERWSKDSRKIPIFNIPFGGDDSHALPFRTPCQAPDGVQSISGYKLFGGIRYEVLVEGRDPHSHGHGRRVAHRRRVSQPRTCTGGRCETAHGRRIF